MKLLNLIVKRNHYKNFFEKNIKNSKNIWKGVNELIKSKRNTSSGKISLEINGGLSSDPERTGEEFNSFFTSIADQIREKIPQTRRNFRSYLKNRTTSSLFFKPISQEDVVNIIKSLDPTKSTGPFSLSSRIINILLYEIADILKDIFNLSLQTGIFPKSLKHVKVVPIYKNKGSPYEVSNYRPISLLSNIEKIFEKLVYARVISFLDSKNILFKRQYGFRSKHSTTHSLIHLTEQIRQSLDKGGYSCGILVDFQKAFDTVDHQILLQKLYHYGVRGKCNKWFQSYLQDREQYVSVSGIKSKSRTVKHGVPQGSVLGPLLFLIYINDLPNALIFSDPFIFADDTALIYSDENLKRINKRMNIDLKLLVHWLKANKIGLNADKTEAILFKTPRKKLNFELKLKLNGKRLLFSSCVKYLGITLDENLSWTQHKNTVALKLRRSNGAISKLRHYVPRSIMLSVYYALFHSNLSYGLQAWGQTINGNCRIFKLQKTAVRLISFSNYNTHSEPLFNNLQIPTIPNLIFSLNICLVYQSLTQLNPTSIQEILNLSYIQNRFNTRGAAIKLLTRPYAKTTRHGLNSIRYFSILNWNSLQICHSEVDLTSCSYSKIKKLALTYCKRGGTP